MSLECDHTSVGVLVWHGESLLLIERKNFPFGFAPPAGHVDDHGSYEEAARIELEEEVGLHATSISLVIEGRKQNPCRRVGGNWHYWKVFEATVDGQLERFPITHDHSRQQRNSFRIPLV
jgi:ADP-ribose pyrophosphatase YjhB (NUDIX family)